MTYSNRSIETKWRVVMTTNELVLGASIRLHYMYVHGQPKVICQAGHGHFLDQVTFDVVNPSPSIPKIDGRLSDVFQNSIARSVSRDFAAIPFEALVATDVRIDEEAHDVVIVEYYLQCEQRSAIYVEILEKESSAEESGNAESPLHAGVAHGDPD